MIGLTSMVVFLLIVHQYCDGRRPYVDHPTCPRRQSTTESGRPCPRKCHAQSGCRASNRQCDCNGVCGMTCVKIPRAGKKRCHPVRDVVNGSWESMTSSPGRRGYRVDSIVRYWCDEGFTLDGPVERVCLSDGSWSDAAPKCSQTSEISSWPTTGTKRCLSPPVVPYGRHNASAGRKSFPVGTRLVYRCRRGYNMEGPFRVICVDEGRWAGPQITCKPRSCGHPGEIANGVRNGSSFTYHERVSYTCLEGYELTGRPYRVCQANGRWSGRLPTCRPIVCKTLAAPEHGRIVIKEKIPWFGSNVSFACERGYQLTGSVTRTCSSNGTWDGTPAVCERVHCLLPRVFPNGYIDGDPNPTVGSVVDFKCLKDMLLEGESREKWICRANGTWSKPVPKCWRPCVMPSLANGIILQPRDVAPGTTVKHGSTLQYNCSKGFRPPRPTATTCCHDGKWLTKPICLAAPCKGRPSLIANGIVRYHHRQHGTSALYECNYGFRLVGSNFTLCQYGEWQAPPGDKPKCVPNRCAYPGNITHGRVLLIGQLGKYEYRRYVQPVGHNEQIEFECNKYFRLVGPRWSTCVNGHWSPPQLPKCKPRRHPHRYYVHSDESPFGKLHRASVSPGRHF